MTTRTASAGGTLYRLSAFTDTPDGGNPAGVWIGDRLPDAGGMQAIARRVGFSETAFVAPREGAERTVRYFSPEAEVPFCGHATIAAGVQLGELSGSGRYRFTTAAGSVDVDVRIDGDVAEASLTSVEPTQRAVPDDVLLEVLASLHWQADELDASIPPVIAYAGAWHLVLAAATQDRLDRLDYDFDELKRIMLAADLTTVQLIRRESAGLYHSRNPFPVGGVVEDPATGAAAAALGGYLRNAGLTGAPTTITIRQGVAMGRPSTLTVHIPVEGGIIVSGRAVRLPG